jgi:hypothetical protein
LRDQRHMIQQQQQQQLQPPQQQLAGPVPHAAPQPQPGAFFAHMTPNANGRSRSCCSWSTTLQLVLLVQPHNLAVASPCCFSAEVISGHCLVLPLLLLCVASHRRAVLRMQTCAPPRLLGQRGSCWMPAATAALHHTWQTLRLRGPCTNTMLTRT